MEIKLFNTLTRRKETFVPTVEGKVNMYVCGPTVYDYFHIGNARVFIVFDVIRRYLQYRGYRVKYIQNYTDIDDKMIKRASEEGISVKELAEKFIKAYQEDASWLGVRPADFHPRATEHIGDIIEIVKKLEKKGLAYRIGGDVYFSIKDFPGYGKLSGQDPEEREAGARVEVDLKKKHPMDFALWKAAKPGEPCWESPWGKGRPGWHIECSSMAMRYLDGVVDIHAGGQDLIFPHHENEIAQSEGAYDRSFARYWLHAGYLNINEKKMSKSLGNVLTIRELKENYSPLAIRYFMLSAHYRHPINFSYSQLEQAESAVKRLNILVENIKDRLQRIKGSSEEAHPAPEERGMSLRVEQFRKKFLAAMDDDFNTADALSVLFELARETNIYLDHKERQDPALLQDILSFYQEANEVLGFLEQKEAPLTTDYIEEMIARREKARRERDWATADSIRDKLKEQGVTLEDTLQGTRWRFS